MACDYFLLCLANNGKINKEVKAAIIEPNTMVPPKRCVGGNDEKKKIPKPAQIISVEVMMGCHIRCVT